MCAHLELLRVRSVDMTAAHLTTHSPGDRPFQARALTLPEIRRGDVHSFVSPKESGRLVRVLGLARIAQALLIEMDFNIVAYIERPRVLEVGKERHEICFWQRDRHGEERMLMIVPGTRRVGADTSARREHRRAETLIEAARAAHLPLQFVHEGDVLAQSQRIALAYRLLPDVQSAQQLTNRGQLQDLILELLAQHPRLRFSQIVAGTEGYHPADVQCVLAFLLHAGQLRCDAADRLLRNTLFEVVP